MEDRQLALSTPLQDTQSKIGALDPVNANTQVDGGHVGYGSKDIERENEEYFQANQYSMEGGAGAPIDFVRGVARDFQNGGNIAVDVIHTLQRAADAGDEDTGWTAARKEDFINKNKKDITPGQEWRYYATLNPLGAQLLLNDSKEQRKSQRISAQLTGLSGFAAPMVAGIVDIDTPLALFSGGLSAGAKTGIQASRAGRALAGGVSGAAIGTALGATDYVFNPNMEAMDVAMFGIMGGGLGLLGGAVAGRNRAQSVVDDMTEEVGGILREGKIRDMEASSPVEAPFAKPEPVWEGTVVGKPKEGEVKNPLEGTPEFTDRQIEAGDVIGSSSAGAMSVRPAQTTTLNMPAGESKNIVGQAEGILKTITNFDDELYAPTWNTNNAITDAAGKAAHYFSKGIQALGVGTDFMKAFRSQSAVDRVMAYHILESASGIGNNSKSAAVLAESFRKEMIAKTFPYENAWNEYRGQAGVNPVFGPFTDKGRQVRRQFDEAVVTELMARRHGGTLAADGPIKRAADAVDRFHEFDIEVGQGRGGNKGIEAYDQMQKQSGYVKQEWDGANMVRMYEDAMRQGGRKAAELMKRKYVQAIEEDYKVLHTNIPPDKARVIAEAVVERAMTSRRGMGRDMLGLLSGDESEFIKAALVRQGIKPTEIDSIINSLIGSRDEKARAGHTQSRIDVDFRSVSSSGIRMMDLLVVDPFTQMHQRAASTSGGAAMAAKGWRKLTDFEAWVKAAEAEKKAQGIAPETGIKSLVNNETGPEFWKNMWNAIHGKPINGGITPEVSMLMKTTRLAFMNQLGLTSSAEFGAVAGALGLKEFGRHAGSQFREMLSNADSPLSKELKHLGIMVPDHKVQRNDMMFEIEKGDPNSPLIRRADLFLNKASRAQGYLSGFFHVTEIQHRIAQTGTISRVFEGLVAKDKAFSADRLKSMGFDPKVFQKYVDAGVVEFDSKGNLVNMHTDKWAGVSKDSYNDIEHLRTASTRVSNQLIQKAMLGESNTIFHANGLAQLFFQFKSFPLLAMEKQFHRNLRMADSALLQTFFFGIIMASAAYAAKQTINGNTQNLTWDKMARGGLNMSNLTGWMPMWIDPIGAAMGMDSVNMSGYSSRGGGPSVVAIPAAFSALDNIVKAPFAAGRVLTPGLEYSNADVRTLQTGTGIGQMYGMSYLLNSIKHEKKSRKNPEAETVEPSTEDTPEAPRAPVDKAAKAAAAALKRVNKSHETGDYNYRDIMTAAGLDPDNP